MNVENAKDQIYYKSDKRFTMGEIEETQSSKYDPEIGHFRKEIFHDLRTELGHLKTCQTSILILSATGAGLFFSLLRTDSYIPPEYLVLLPLIFLIPLWIIFFEKARTIARIVGFIRVQEKLYMYKSNLAAIGWESAMKLYRSKQNIWDHRELDEYFKRSEPSQSPTTSIYWFMVYCTFFSLITICLIISMIFLPIHFLQKINLVVAIVITFIISFPLLKLHKIGKKKNSNIESRHTDLKRYFKRTEFLVISYIILAICFFMFSFLLLKNDYPNNIIIQNVIPYSVFSIFFTVFLIGGSVASWLFLNLVKSRYSYPMFEQRWQIILDIEIDEERKEVYKRNWNDFLKSPKNPI
jgi:hypothetical protein